MHLTRTLFSRCVALFHRRQLDIDLDDELLAHIELAVEENRRHGMTDVEARTAAMRAFGGLTQVKEEYRMQRGLPFLEVLSSDLRVALRQLLKSQGFTLTVILTVA
jgi:hypothetical protein